MLQLSVRRSRAHWHSLTHSWWRGKFYPDVRALLPLSCFMNRRFNSISLNSSTVGDCELRSLSLSLSFPFYLFSLPSLSHCYSCLRQSCRSDEWSFGESIWSNRYIRFIPTSSLSLSLSRITRFCTIGNLSCDCWCNEDHQIDDLRRHIRCTDIWWRDKKMILSEVTACIWLYWETGTHETSCTKQFVSIVFHFVCKKTLQLCLSLSCRSCVNTSDFSRAALSLSQLILFSFFSSSSLPFSIHSSYVYRYFTALQLVDPL